MITKFEEVVELLKERLDNNFDCSVAITGEKGIGKSTLAIQIARAINGESFDLRKHVIFNPEFSELEKAIRIFPPKTALVIDEAIKVTYKLDFMKKEQKEFNKMLTLARKHYKVLLFCIPHFVDMSSFMKKTEIVLWFYILKRGKAFVFVKDQNPFIDDPWHFKENLKIIQKFRKNIFDLDGLEKGLRHCVNYAGEFSFEKLEGTLEKEYERVKLTF